jgi:hypothetical protein
MAMPSRAQPMGILLVVRLHPNPPRMITVVIAVALLLIGISGTVFPLPFVDSLAEGVLRPVLGATGLGLEEQTWWLFLFLSPVLLVIGSLLPGI